MNSINKDRNILFIVPQNRWTTRERLALKDMLIAKNHGYNVFLCTMTTSYLALKARENNIDVLPIEKHFLNRFTKFHKYFRLRKILKKIQVDVIHCYEFSFLFSLALQLRALNLTSLVITQDHSIDKPLQQFIYKPLISRIDFLILLNKHLRNDVVGNLGLPAKKIEYFGMGIKVSDPENPSIIDFNFQAYQDYFLTGVYLTPAMKNLNLLEPIFLALKILNQNPPSGLLSKLVMVTDVEFKNLKFIKELREKIEELKIEDEVIFVTTSDVDGVMTKLNLWVSLEESDLIEDYAITALNHEVPVLLGRNFCARELLSEFEGIGETYKFHDSRELREKWARIIMGRTIYKDKVRLFKFFIEKEHDFRIYRDDLLDLYGKMTLRRARVYRKTN